MKTTMIALLVAAAAAHAQEPKRGGELVLKNAVAGATVSLVRVPDAVKDMESVLRLWSENEPAIAEALVRLSDADAAFVTGRLRELSAVGPEKTTALAKKLAERVAPSPEAVEVVRRTVADINGLARFLDVPAGTFQLLSTRPASPDFLAIGIRTDGRGVVAIDCAAARLPKPAPEFVGSRVAVRSAGGPVKVVAGGKVVAEIASKEGEVIELQSPARLTVEPSGPVAPPLADGRVGMVQLVHHRYGVFIRLEPGVQLIAGESIAIYRDGAEVTRAEILLVCGSDEKYPDGAVQVSPGAEVKKGDEVRRVKP